VINVVLTIHQHGPNGIAGVLSSALESEEESPTAGDGESDLGVSPDR